MYVHHQDCGAVRQSIYLYERSVEACVPGSEFEKHLVNMTLTLVHAYEVCAEFQAAFDCIKRCLVKRMAAVIGGSLGGAAATLPVKRVLQVLQHVTNVFDPALRRGTAKGAQYRQVCVLCVCVLCIGGVHFRIYWFDISPLTSGGAPSRCGCVCGRTAQGLWR